MMNPPSITKNAGIVGFATLLSRLLGFCRDMVIAGFFGAGMWSDAFLVAFRFPNMFRKLFAEGALSISFIPVFTNIYTQKGRPEAFQMARAALCFLFIALTVLTLTGIYFSDVLIHMIAPGFAHSATKFTITVKLTQIMFPYILMICMAALCMGILNALNHFITPAFAPVLLNIAILGTLFSVAWFFSEKSERVFGMAYGVLLGGALQFFVQIPVLIQKGVWQWRHLTFFHPALKKAGLTVLPSILGAGAYQINFLVAVLMASQLHEGSVTYLYFADRLIQFPLGIFVLSISTVILPTLSNQAASNDLQALSQTFTDAFRAVFFITLPAMAGLLVLSHPIIALLFQHGDFDSNAGQITAQTLIYLGTGLWSFAGIRIVVSVFFAMQDFKTPATTATLSILINIAGSLFLMARYSQGGLALAVSIAATIQLLLLVVMLSRRLEGINWSSIFISFLKSFFCAFLMGIVVWWIAFDLIPFLTGKLEMGKFFLIFQVLLGIISGIIIYVGAAHIANSSELAYIISLKKERTAKIP